MALLALLFAVLYQKSKNMEMGVMCIDHREFDQNLSWLKEGDDAAKKLNENAEEYQKSLKVDQLDYFSWSHEMFRRSSLLEKIQDSDQKKCLVLYFQFFDFAFLYRPKRLIEINDAMEQYLSQIETQPNLLGNGYLSQLVPIEFLYVLEPMLSAIASKIQIEFKKKMSAAHQARLEQGKRNRELFNKYFEPVLKREPSDYRKELRDQYVIFQKDYKIDRALKIFSSKRNTAKKRTPLSSTAFFNRFYRWRKHFFADRAIKDQEDTFAKLTKGIKPIPLGPPQTNGSQSFPQK